MRTGLLFRQRVPPHAIYPFKHGPLVRDAALRPMACYCGLEGPQGAHLRWRVAIIGVSLCLASYGTYPVETRVQSKDFPVTL